MSATTVNRLGRAKIWFGRLNIPDFARELARNAEDKPAWYLGLGWRKWALTIILEKEE